ncbi:MAG: hypothetical protein IT307_04735 [Chloroflexi bacterium]|nr:hypothetical protein [Chloroflexota bacterium]
MTTQRDPEQLLDSLQAAYASGRHVDGETLLFRALDQGVPWDHATRAVARGVEQRVDASMAPV